MENLISKAKLFLEAYKKAHPVLFADSKKDVACYMAYHELKNAIKEHEESSELQAHSFACLNEERCEKECNTCKFIFSKD
jgi:hypothetical protein